MIQSTSGSLNRIWWQRILVFAVAAVQIAAIVWVGRNGGLDALAARLRQAAPPRPQVASLQEWQRAMARDPKPGARLPAVVLADCNGGQLKIGGSHRPGGLLFISTCTDCVATRVAYWDRLQRKHPEVDLRVVPLSPDVDVIRHFTRSRGLLVPFVVEGADRVTGPCNPFFLPRAYLFDRSGRLTYVQPPSIPTGTALKRISAALSQGAG